MRYTSVRSKSPGLSTESAWAGQASRGSRKWLRRLWRNGGNPRDGKRNGGRKMDGFFGWVAEFVCGRIEGPLKFRFLLQPCIATILAVKSGIADAKAGRTPYFWSLFSEPDQRLRHLREGWKSVSRIFLFALFLDIAYQWIVSRRFHPGQALLVAITLAIVPYLLFRGAVTRMVRRRSS